MTETLPQVQRTEPGPPGLRLPDIPGPWETAVAAWRVLRRMSTAVVLLLVLATAAVLATFIPQEPVIAPTVADWRDGLAGPGAEWARLLDALSLFDVFGSWWFMTLTGLLIISLTGCLVPRWRAFAQVARRPPPVGRNLTRLRLYARFPTTLAPEDALAAAEPALRGFRRRRVEADDGSAQLAAERGHWREGGSLIFHSSFYIMLIGVVIGHTFGWTGQVNIVEGQGFTDTAVTYLAQAPGRFWDAGDHRAFTVRLDDFDVSYHDNFVPADFVSTVTMSDGGEEVLRGVPIRVNHPLVYRGMKIFQARFGYAPQIVIRTRDGVELFRGPVTLVQEGPLWVGREKVAVGNPAAGAPQIAMQLALIPDGEIVNGELRINSPEPRSPRLAFSLYSGDLGLERAVPLSTLPWREDQLVGQAMLLPGGSAEVIGGLLTVEFVDLPLWSGFQVTHAPGRKLLLVAGAMLLTGLLPSLYSYRRRIWVQARAGEVVLAGVALQRKSAFAEDFERIRERLATAFTPQPPKEEG